MIKWTITNLDRSFNLNDKKDVVTCAFFSVEGIDDNDNSKKVPGASGSAKLETSNLSSFTDFELLTEGKVVGWVQAVLGKDKVDEIEKTINDKLSELNSPTHSRGLPQSWL